MLWQGPLDDRARTRPDAVIGLQFDQKVDLKSVAKAFELRLKNKAVSVRVVSTDKLGESTHFAYKAAQEQPDRWLFVKPTKPLKLGAQYTMQLRPGIISLEGPRRTKETIKSSFKTFAPLKVVRQRCGYGLRCRVDSTVRVEFNHPLSSKDLADEAVQVLPKVHDLTVTRGYNSLSISGSFKAKTKYRLTINQELTDTFGQHLDKPYRWSFKTAARRPELRFYGPGPVVLEPAARGQFSVFSSGVRQLTYTVYAVEPGQWPGYQRFIRSQSRRDLEPKLNWQRVKQEKIRIGDDSGELTETRIHLTSEKTGKHGHFILKITHPGERRPAYAWIQVTEIGINLAGDGDKLLAWATELDTGKPLSNVTIDWSNGQQTAVTDEHGLARLKFNSKHRPEYMYAVASRGADSALIDVSRYDSNWRQHDKSPRYRWHHVTDRNLYRPGERVRTKGWVRVMTAGVEGDIKNPIDGTHQIRYKVRGSRGNAIKTGIVTPNRWGGFELDFALPNKANLGYATIELELTPQMSGAAGSTTHTSFQIEEFRRPEYEVKVSVPPQTYLFDDHVIPTASAQYLAGGPLPDAPIEWHVSACATPYTPPNSAGFSFGRWRPWWSWRHRETCARKQMSGETTDHAGAGDVDVQASSLDRSEPLRISAEARVTDVNRQAWSGKTSWLVHPARYYVGTRAKTTFVPPR